MFFFHFLSRISGDPELKFQANTATINLLRMKEKLKSKSSAFSLLMNKFSFQFKTIHLFSTLRKRCLKVIEKLKMKENRGVNKERKRERQGNNERSDFIMSSSNKM